MKRILLLWLLLAASLHLSAQQASAIDKFFQKYESDQSFTVVSISPKMFSMFSKIDLQSQEGQQLMQVIKKVRGLKVLVKDNTKDADHFFKEASSLIGKEFEELMTVRDGKTNVRFMVKDNAKGNIEELVMLVGSDSEFVALSLIGDIDLNEISRIANGMNIEGLDKLKDLKTKP
jgi:hypothetical protein